MDETAIIMTANNLSFVPPEALMKAYVEAGRFTPEEAFLLIIAAEVFLRCMAAEDQQG